VKVGNVQDVIQRK